MKTYLWIRGNPRFSAFSRVQKIKPLYSGLGDLPSFGTASIARTHMISGPGFSAGAREGHQSVALQQLG